MAKTINPADIKDWCSSLFQNGDHLYILNRKIIINHKEGVRIQVFPFDSLTYTEILKYYNSTKKYFNHYDLRIWVNLQNGSLPNKGRTKDLDGRKYLSIVFLLITNTEEKEKNVEPQSIRDLFCQVIGLDSWTDRHEHAFHQLNPNFDPYSPNCMIRLYMIHTIYVNPLLDYGQVFFSRQFGFKIEIDSVHRISDQTSIFIKEDRRSFIQIICNQLPFFSSSSSSSYNRKRRYDENIKIQWQTESILCSIFCGLSLSP